MATPNSAPLEIVVLTGIPGSGKSTLAKHRFHDHVRINLDTVKTRRQEGIRIRQAIQESQSLVIDNTNVTVKSRKRYIDMARQFGVRVSSIYLVCPLELALQRNSKRRGKENVPDFVVKIYYRRLQPPTLEEGFDSVEVYGVGNENSTKTKQSIA